ncbi:hypothetical protein D9C73_003529 [Collichthys lucidus]|uniref:Uncharacterized protein n=1 Tax=Collichthys lucidus TaxID=240159 RepID=A0A4U5U8V7_COLLU|nr:hypothetical protein D9C73_003529 [Collichthys lucidus]
MSKGRKKKKDNYPGEDDSDDHCATLADACEANANVASSPSPATLEDILVAIKMLDSRVDTRRQSESHHRQASAKAPLQYDGCPVYIFPVFTSATIKKRQAFRAIREKCRAKSIRCGFLYPAWFVVTVNNNTSTFTTPAKAEEFLSREADGWDAVASASPRRETE